MRKKTINARKEGKRKRYAFEVNLPTVRTPKAAVRQTQVVKWQARQIKLRKWAVSGPLSAFCLELGFDSARSVWLVQVVRRIRKLRPLLLCPYCARTQICANMAS